MPKKKGKPLSEEINHKEGEKVARRMKQLGY
jgi:hypothetical protein